MPDNDGYEPWPIDDPNHPYPVGGINALDKANDTLFNVKCSIRFPQNIPFEKSVAERAVGTKNAWKVWIAVRSTRKAGKVESHILCRARHVMWFPSHEETGMGADVEIKVEQATIVKKGMSRILKDAKHGPMHSDGVDLAYNLLVGGTLSLQFLGMHYTFGPMKEYDQPMEVPPSGAPTPGGTPKPPPPPPPPPSGGTPKPTDEKPRPPKKGPEEGPDVASRRQGRRKK